MTESKISVQTEQKHLHDKPCHFNHFQPDLLVDNQGHQWRRRHLMAAESVKHTCVPFVLNLSLWTTAVFNQESVVCFTFSFTIHQFKRSIQDAKGTSMQTCPLPCCQSVWPQSEPMRHMPIFAWSHCNWLSVLNFTGIGIRPNFWPQTVPHLPMLQIQTRLWKWWVEKVQWSHHLLCTVFAVQWGIWLFCIVISRNQFMMLSQEDLGSQNSHWSPCEMKNSMTNICYKLSTCSHTRLECIANVWSEFFSHFILRVVCSDCSAFLGDTSHVGAKLWEFCSRYEWFGRRNDFETKEA